MITKHEKTKSMGAERRIKIFLKFLYKEYPDGRITLGLERLYSKCFKARDGNERFIRKIRENFISLEGKTLILNAAAFELIGKTPRAKSLSSKEIEKSLSWLDQTEIVLSYFDIEIEVTEHKLKKLKEAREHVAETIKIEKSFKAKEEIIKLIDS